MVFSSVVFVLAFLPVVLVLHSVLFRYARAFDDASKALLGEPAASPNAFWLCNVFLLLASLVFYAWGEPYHVMVMITSAFANYSFGLFLAAGGSAAQRRRVMICSVLFNLGLLGFYKYMNLFAESGGITLLNTLLPAGHKIPANLKIALPLGISFYTFQAMSYVLDVYYGRVRATLRFTTFACYLTMFPQLVAGPIVRYADVEAELGNRVLSLERFSAGAGRFIVGLAKKLLAADTLGKVADAAFGAPARELPAFAAWVGIAAYALQIYYDFGGYSDMAIGMGHMLGFTFLENFNYPYAAQSVRDFWRRWHMSLSTWFRDYLFIPLGGSRKGAVRTAFSLVVVFALCGLWHGASWVFLAWGLYHGFFLALERVFPRFTGALPRPARHLYVVLVFLMGWVLFRANTFIHAQEYYQALLGFYDAGIQANRVWLALYAMDVYLAFAFGVLGAVPLIPWLKAHLENFAERWRLAAWVYYAGGPLLLLVLLLLCYMPLFGATYTSFIYFRF